MSEDEKARMACEAKQAEIHDQLTRIKSAKEEGKIEVAQNFLNMGLTIEQVAKGTELPVEKVIGIQKNITK